MLVTSRLTCGGLAGAGFAAAVEVDQTQLNRLFLNLVRIGETHGIKFPREFGLFLKQLLYFDRYTRILAPSLQVRSISLTPVLAMLLLCEPLQLLSLTMP